MKNKRYIKLEYDDPAVFHLMIDALKLSCSPNQREISIVSVPTNEFRSQFIDKIVNDGLSNFLNSQNLMEDITAPSMKINDIENIIIKFVDKIFPTKNLVIIDGYFFPKATNYSFYDIFCRILDKHKNNIENITVIHNSKANNAAISTFKQKISMLNPLITVKTHKTDIFHDRFWISPSNKKGVVIGTSLNGIGKKIALVDKISDQDVISLLKELDDIGISFFNIKNTEKKCLFRRIMNFFVDKIK